MPPLNVKQKLTSLSLISLSTLVLVGSTGWRQSSQNDQLLTNMAIKMSALRNHLESDMMHDAIRGDVMTALYSAQIGDVEAQNAVKADIIEHADIFRENVANTLSLNISADIDSALNAMKPDQESYIDAGAHMVALSFTDLAAAHAALPEFLTTFRQLEDEMGTFSETVGSNADLAVVKAVGSSKQSLQLLAAILAAAIIISVFGSLAVFRGIMRPLHTLFLAIENIRTNKGALERVTGFTGEFLNIENSFNGVLDDLKAKQAEESTRAQAAFRVQQALNSATTNMVLTDANMQVIYINASALAMFQKAETEIRKTLPQFSSRQIMGGKLEQLLPTAQLAREISQTSNLREDKIALGNNTYHVIATAVIDEQGCKLGVVCEWQDLTEQLEAEHQIEAVLNAAVNGRLATRLEITRFRGFMHTLSGAVNNMLDAITIPVTEVKEVITSLASGDLTKRMSTQYGGDFGVLSEAVNTSVSNFTDMVSKIVASSFNIDTSATEISEGTQNLNDRTQEQAAALEETFRTLQNLSARSEDNTANTKSANHVAQSATAEAQQGCQIVQSAVQAMDEINVASNKISNIISVIDGISFQSNLLALNASVEAARAGEQGRGFAVVANEVRALAQRSANAAAEIRTLINDTVGKVNQGSKLVNQSGDTLREIMASINKVGTIIAEISAATSEQTHGFLEVNKAIGQLDAMTQQNAALVEESAAASESMADQSNCLRDLMNFFKIDEANTMVTAAVSRRKPGAKIADQAAARSPAKSARNRSSAPGLKMVAGQKQIADENHWGEF
jgi:methyl-accepting chemotaxis protein/methyl-accepting chemotaxis protein-1 (serine sensor receptor)